MGPRILQTERINYNVLCRVVNRRRQLLVSTVGKALILHILHLWLSIVLTPISIPSRRGGGISNKFLLSGLFSNLYTSTPSNNIVNADSTMS